jgi:predicted transcriptional regulator
MKRTIARAGTTREFFKRGRNWAKLAGTGQRLPESRLITFEDPVDMMRILSPVKLRLLRAVKAHPGSLASRLRRGRNAVARDVGQLQRFGLFRVADEVLPGHGRMKTVSAVAGEIRLEAVIA